MFRLRIVCLVLVCCVSCGRRQLHDVFVLHVLRDPAAQFAGRLRQADLRFGRTSARLESGKHVIVATNEGNSYADLLGRIAKVPPSLLIVDPRASLPAEVVSQLRAEPPKLICGGAAYIPRKVSGEEREAAELYLRFLEGHCEAHGV